MSYQRSSKQQKVKNGAYSYEVRAALGQAVMGKDAEARLRGMVATLKSIEKARDIEAARLIARCALDLLIGGKVP